MSSIHLHEPRHSIHDGFSGVLKVEEHGEVFQGHLPQRLVDHRSSKDDLMHVGTIQLKGYYEALTHPAQRVIAGSYADPAVQISPAIGEHLAIKHSISRPPPPPRSAYHVTLH